MLYIEYLDWYLLLNSILPNIITFLFFLYFILTLIYRGASSKISSSFIKNIYLNIYWLFIVFLWGIFFCKFYLNFKYFNYAGGFKTNELRGVNIGWNFSIFGDVLVLLCLTTLMISWIFLSERYLQQNPAYTTYFFIFVIFTLNMVSSNNLLVMFLFFEFIFVPSLFFVYFLGYSQKVERTVRYLLVWTFSGSFIVLISLLLLQSLTGSLDIIFLSYFKFSELERCFFFFTFFIGFGVKIPLWPFHYWLTKVHVEAPTGFSIFLSGFLVKTALFCLIVFISFFKYSIAGYIGLALTIWGALEASIRMWVATDIKRLIAFATIQEMNLIVIFIFLANPLHYQVLSSFIVVHGVLSALFFFLVDQVQKRFSSRNLLSLGGLAYYISFLPLIIWLSLLVFRGFPIFIKFLIEWELLIMLSEHWGIVGIVIFITVTVVAVIGFARIWFTILYGQPNRYLISSVDILRIDKFIALFMLVILTLLTVVIFLF